jgi:hypothetical protein
MHVIESALTELENATTRDSDEASTEYCEG